MELCGPIWVESINGKKYILVIVDDYYRYTWTHFLRSKDETPEVLIDFLRMIQRGLQAQYGVVKRRNHTLVEAARTMLSASKLLLFFWAEAIATASDLTQLDIQTTPEPTTQEQTVNADENINQAENVMFDEDKFINPFGIQTRDHPLEQVLGNPSQPVMSHPAKVETRGVTRKDIITTQWRLYREFYMK
ncbi:putative ribonuclease H-like domain-containing protein [Tanacetum coccineum]